jgi:alpha-L-rhamnosidase
MRKTSLLLLAFQCIILSAFSQVKVDQLKTENLTNPIGLDVLQPYFSWKLISNQRNVMQTAYELRVSTNAAALTKADAWKSGKINSDQSIHVPYKGIALQANKKYYWQVRVWDNKGNASAWSAVHHWQMGLVNPTDWTAQWI